MLAKLINNDCDYRSSCIIQKANREKKYEDIKEVEIEVDKFEKTKEYDWLIKNSKNFGFILRYPEGKEYITGYAYEPWHFRYVGKEAATYIMDNNITFEEYYAYFVDNK